jgi:hypothetical protein
MKFTASYSNAREEFQAAWLPNITDSGLDRLIDLLSSRSPLLIHGAFTKALPMGCLASQIAWHHPRTEHKHEDAGICWLARIAKLNPATSAVLLQWDHRGLQDRELVADLIALCRQEQADRLTKLCERLTFEERPVCHC